VAIHSIGESSREKGKKKFTIPSEIPAYFRFS